jgi:DNA-binding NtrC family response regulator
MNSPTVLLVGSDEALLTGLAEMLAASGHTVVSCPCFDEAKRYLQTATPHAIVTDVRLGAFNGLHLVLLAKERAPATTAIVYSGREDCGLRQEAATSGATYPEKEMLSVGLLAHLHGTEASA